MDEQSENIRIISFPNISPVGLLSQASSNSSCSPTANISQDIEKTPGCSVTLEAAANSQYAVFFKKIPRTHQAGCSTTVRLLSAENGYSTETTLQPHPLEEVCATSPHAAGKERKKNVIIRKHPSKPCYSRTQWFLITLSWIVAMNGFIMFLSFLGLIFSGYQHLLRSSLGNVFVTINGIISLLSGVYFFNRIRKYLV